MHTGTEIEGSRHLGKLLLFLTDEELNSLDTETLIETALSWGCDGMYFGAELTIVNEESITSIVDIMETQPALAYTIEIPISNRGRWLAVFNEQASDTIISNLHVIHRIDNMDAMSAASQYIRESHDVKIYYEWGGDVITFRWDTATTVHYPSDYKGDKIISGDKR